MLPLSRNLKLFLITAAAALLAGCGTSETGGPPASGMVFERVVVFGDSNVDNGNLFRLTKQRLPAAPRWQGRESNGPVVVEYLAENLKARLEDHAVSGATSGVANIVARLGPAYAEVAETGVARQLDRFEQAGGKLSSADLVVLWAGSNDIFGARRQDRADLDRRIGAAVLNIETALTRLRNLGAHRVIVATRTPREIIGSDNDLNGVDLNSALLAKVEEIAAHSGLDLRVYDAYARVSDMMTHPARYGFTEVRVLCVEVPACAADRYGTEQIIAHGYVNWDGAHKTTRVHKLMASEIGALAAR